MAPERPTLSRQSTRVTVGVTVEITTTDGRRIKGTARDLSVKGLAVDTDQRIDAGTPCHLTLFLDGGLGSVKLEAEALVVRSDDRGLALELGAVHLDSLEHLRKLVLYNSSNPTAIEREFDRHQGLLRVE